MTNSTHYNLNLVEGTDLVNPLVQDVPNYEAIDAQMYSNECASIGTAVELLTGTVHALTRTNTDTPVFRFTATADYEAGETFVVDGVQVTALLPSGEALGTGAYVIGSEVLCVLRDTRLTFFMAGGIQSVAADSDKLGGQLPAYYGTAADVQTAQSTATAAGVLAQANASQITSINESLAYFRPSYIDLETVIAQFSGATKTYTATEDCWLQITQNFNNSTTWTNVKINDIVVAPARISGTSSYSAIDTTIVFCPSGSTITAYSNDAYALITVSKFK